jgi:uncharacterized protein YlxP (DUF503 family)
MIVGICTVQLRLDDNHSLKGKRSQLKPLLARLHRDFNIAAVEVGQQNDRQLTEIGIAAVGSDRVYVDRVLQQAVTWIENSRLDWQLVDYQIEIIY